MQVVSSRSAHSRVKDNKKSKSNSAKPLIRPANLRNKLRHQKTQLRDLVEYRFMKMDEDHNRIRDEILGGPQRYE